MASDEEYLYYTSGDESAEEDAFSEAAESEDGEDPVPDGDGDPIVGRRKSYAILTEEDIRQRQLNDISSISIAFNVSREESCAILYHYNWTASRVQDKWFSDEDKVRQSVGILETRTPVNSSKAAKKFKCKICYEYCKIERIASAFCGHPYCTDCWQNYISMSINIHGPGCLKLKCPEPNCKAIAGLELIDCLTSDEDKERYYKYLLRSYVEDSEEIKWCPSPACENAIEYDTVDGCESFEVTCNCSSKFCWNCLEDRHRPVDCETVANWNKKNSDEAENTTWILAYTKPCPKCKRAIEKNQGCNHMTCGRPCGFQFCWYCLGDWQNHSNPDAGCNRFRGEEKKETVEMARKHLQRYTHYYERWASNDKSWKMAITELNRFKTELTQKLARVHGEPESQLGFVTEAWEQIVECRRVLKLTYMYGYYILEDDSAKRSFFEYLQGDAEQALERLHHCTEMEMKPYLEEKLPEKSIVDFKTKLAGLTTVTKNFFENLVRALENKLSEVGNGKKEEINSLCVEENYDDGDWF